MKHDFPVDLRYSRRNLRKLSKDNAIGPDGSSIPKDSILKKLNDRYKNDFGFQQAVDSTISFLISLILAVGLVTIGTFCRYYFFEP